MKSFYCLEWCDASDNMISRPLYVTEGGRTLRPCTYSEAIKRRNDQIREVMQCYSPSLDWYWGLKEVIRLVEYKPNHHMYGYYVGHYDCRIGNTKKFNFEDL